MNVNTAVQMLHFIILNFKYRSQYLPQKHAILSSFSSENQAVFFQGIWESMKVKCSMIAKIHIYQSFINTLHPKAIFDLNALYKRMF